MALSEEILLFSVFGIAVLLLGGTITVLAVYISQRKIRDKERQLLHAVIKAQENEQMRIGQDLHDEVGPLLTLVLQSVNERLGESPEIESVIKQAVSSVRMVSQNLHPPHIQSQGLNYALSEMCNNFTKLSGMSVNYIGTTTAIRPNLEKDVHIFRMVSELVNNAVKHSEASQVHVVLNQDNGELNIQVADDGIGLNAEGLINGMGMKNISSRVKLLKGRKLVKSEPDTGTIITINIPKYG